MPQKANMREIGTVGVEMSGGQSFSEWSTRINQIGANKLFKEMRDNDPVVGAVFFVVEYMLSNQPWHVDVGEGSRAKEAKELVQTCMKDMEHSWSDFIQEALSMLQYGWSYHEIVYKKREDGGIGWRKLPIRAQNTLDYWGTDAKNDVTGMWQNDPYVIGQRVFIPIDKSLHFKTTSANGNPEGRSILRSAVRSYQFLKRLQEVEAIGVERELAGLPLMFVPFEMLDANAPAPTRTRVAEYKRLLMSIRRDEREGIILPSKTDKQGNPTGFDFQLLAGGGKRSIDTNVIITRYENRIATAMLAQFILLGSGGTGSYALADQQASVFTIALQAALQRIADVINLRLIPDLLDLNGFKPEDRPTLRPEKLQDVSLATLATFINQLCATNVLQPDDDLENHLRKMADLPPKGEPRLLVEPLAGEPGSNPSGAGRPKSGSVESKTDKVPDKKSEKDPKGKDAVNVRTDGPRKAPK